MDGGVFKMNRVFCSTGAVIGRPNGRNIHLLEECVPKLECDGFEFMMYSTWYDKVEEVKEVALRTGASFPVFHVEKQVGDRISRNGEGDTEKALELFDINCRLAKALGSKLLVLHLWSGLDSDKDMPHNMELYPRLEEISRAYGLLLTVENVVCNHLDPFTHLVSLSEKFPDISFTFDTKMSQFHSQTEKLYQNKEVFRRIKHFHINDYGGEYMDWSNLKTLHIGRGNVDFDKLFAYLKEQGYSGDFTVEATSFDENGVIDFDSLNRTFYKIREYIK